MENIVLIGMPSCGKSTVGALLANQIGYSFLDCDALIRKASGTELSTYIKEHGTTAFMRLEEEVCSSIRARKTVIAPGGSVCYSPKTMRHFKRIATVVYLYVEEKEVEARIGDVVGRGVVMRGNISTVRELYSERTPLYEQYADLTVNTSGLSLSKAVNKVKEALGL